MLGLVVLLVGDLMCGLGVFIDDLVGLIIVVGLVWIISYVNDNVINLIVVCG